MIERPQFYVAKFPNLSGTATYGNLGSALQTDSDSLFRMFGIACYVFGSAGDAEGAAGNINFTLRFTRPDGTSWFQRRLTSAQALNPYDVQAANGAGGTGFSPPYYVYMSPLSPNMVYPPQTAINIDFENLTANQRVYVVFCGTKVFQDGSIYAPTYPAKYRARPYFGYALQFSSNLLPLSNLPLSVAPDADFVWQTGAQTDAPGSGSLTPVGAMRGLGCRFRDWTGKYYMNDFVPVELVFGFDNSQRPGMVYPEIYIPKNQQIFFDFAEL